LILRFCRAGLAVATCTLVSHSATAQQDTSSTQATAVRIPVGGSSLYAQVIGGGKPIIVLHGGPDFDQRYLLPELDQFSDAFRLIYYDQRGRGQSAEGVRPEDVTIASDVEDLDKVRQHFGFERSAILGHSWGAVLALEYALRYPDRVSQLILMNPAPASAVDVAVLRKSYLEKIGAEMARQREIVASPAYKEGDPAAVTARYRIHFKPAFVHPEVYEKLMARMQAAFFAQGKEGIVKARAVEINLHRGTWEVAGYDLMPKLRSLRIPTLVIAGDRDFIPLEVAQHIAQSIPGVTLVTIKDCGHFSYLECPADTRKAVNDFFSRRRKP
jgi:proline iminopeptidase